MFHLDRETWIKSTIAELSAIMQKAETPRELAQAVIGKLVPLVEGGAGVFHVWRPEAERLELLGSYGFRERKHIGTSYRLGEGLVGQCALEKTSILLTEVPDDYIRITSGLGEAVPRTVLVAPLLSKDSVLGVIEIATFTRLGKLKQALIDQLLPVVALNLEVLDRNRRTRVLLEETQQQAEELQASEEKLLAQSEALQSVNDELRLKSDTLQTQAEELRASEEELRAQREELQATNEELMEKSAALEERQVALEAAREKSEKHALELSVASRYKSEFLANMSHELRTPLNSLLILAKSLSDNEDANLTEDQVDSARIIHESGSHLLRLINDILDLSKVEAGKVEVVPEDILLEDFAVNIQRRFYRLAESRNLFLRVETSPDLPFAMRSDIGKMDQIVNNLVGNAIKFTRQGGVTVVLSRLEQAPTERTASAPHNGFLSLSVQDTGVGVPADKQDHIFQAFEQADGTTSRQFGGTGLGLSISKRLAQLLDGTITLSSVEGQGSTFTLIVPLYPPVDSPVPRAESADVLDDLPYVPAYTVADDRASIVPGDDVILVIEDDDAFARVLGDLSRKRGFKFLRAADGRIGLELATAFRPTGILLDIALPELDGWAVMASLKRMPETRHIPVHFISAIDDTVRGLQMGAAGYLKKPVSKEQMDGVFDRLSHFTGNNLRRVLVVDDDVGSRKATSVLVQADKVEIVEAGMAEEALELMKTQHFDCVVLDLMLPDVSGFELLDRASEMQIALPPVVIYSGKELSYEENLRLREYTDSIVIKGARSPERLVDEVSLFLHSVQTAKPADQQRSARASTEKEQGMEGRVVLVVDDDMRNAFALSKILRGKGFNVVLAQDGQKALAQLKDNSKIEIVLMDIMMPSMDGYATIKEIRRQRKFKSLPILALTAKAMSGDREKCIEAGANDYLSKPVDVVTLVARMRALLCVEGAPA
jgi:signal transduction histidine kinase/DNA-binding response OmpR family regulator